MTSNRSLALRPMAVAIGGAFAAMMAMPLAQAAESDEVSALTQPTSQVEVGVNSVDKGSYKFGEYNGLYRKGETGILNFDLRGGGSYDSDSAFRWRATGSDLGLHGRSLGAEAGNQGSFRLKYNFDEIHRAYSDTYQTFYSGAGTSALTLPTFPAAATRGSSTASSAAALANWQNIQSPCALASESCSAAVNTKDGPAYLIPVAMRNFNVDSQRTRHNLGFDLNVAPGWDFKASVFRELKDGTKLTGVAFGGPARGVLVPEPINSSTDQFRASLNYVGLQSHYSLAYYGSFYRNDTNVWTVDNPFNGTLLATAFGNAAKLVGAPDNDMHRLSLTGGYDFSKTTKLVVSGHYQRMTQDEAFLTGLPATWTIPQTSAHANVVDTFFNGRLTTKPSNDLSLVAGFKYENRKNNTPIANYLVQGGDAATAPSQYTNEPAEKRVEQLNLEADYSLARRQAIKVGYDYQSVRRTATGAETPYRAEDTKENTLRFEYRNNVSDTVTGRVNVSRAQRRVSDYEENDPMPAALPAGSLLPTPDPLLPGFRQFWLADRNQDKVKGVLNLQASESLTLGTSVEYSKDSYSNSPYGLKNADSSVFNLNGSYAASDAWSMSAFYSYENRQSQLDSLAISRFSASTAAVTAAAGFTYLFPHVSGGACAPFSSNIGVSKTGALVAGLPADFFTDPCRQWSEKQRDLVNTFGVGFRAVGLMAGKLELNGDLSYSKARTPIDVTGGAYFSNGNTTAANTLNNVLVAGASFPDITSELTEFKLTGKYTLDKSSAIRLTYLYRKLKSADWQYDAYTNAALGAVAIPSFPGIGIVSPNYTVNAVGVSYIYSFK